ARLGGDEFVVLLPRLRSKHWLSGLISAYAIALVFQLATSPFFATQFRPIAAELAWFGWSAYEVTYFDEPLVRSFRNVVRAGAGGEYLASARMFGKSVIIPFRAGVVFDPQPMREPGASYLALALGTGLRLSALAIDISGQIGRESGSGDSLKAGKIVLSLRYMIDE
ncbi:MAG: hypothetical protein HGA24_05105, partial [Candidatus Aminicenantes bacterium]|nr:hypothetical protein [Candidatus Aminicenantes bacterium]